MNVNMNLDVSINIKNVDIEKKSKEQEMKMLMHYRLISELTLGLVHRELCMNEQEIKVYKDAYADASYAKIGFKGKIVNEKGVIYCPYKKPPKFR